MIYQPGLQEIHHPKRKRTGCSALVLRLNLEHLLDRYLVLFLVGHGIWIVRLRGEFLFANEEYLPRVNQAGENLPVQDWCQLKRA